jgi:hypothetical protein
MSKIISVEVKKTINIQQLWRKLLLLQVEALKYIMLSPTGVLIYLHEDKELSEQDSDRMKACVHSYEVYPDLLELRMMREPLLQEADWRINRAQDNMEDTTALVAYRKALRDITKNYEDGPVEWPAKPW